MINAGKFLRLGYKSACKNNAINISQLQDERLEERILLDHWYPTKWDMSQKVCVYLGWQAFDDVVKDPFIPQGSWKSGPQTGDLPVRVPSRPAPLPAYQELWQIQYSCFCLFLLIWFVFQCYKNNPYDLGQGKGSEWVWRFLSAFAHRISKAM